MKLGSVTKHDKRKKIMQKKLNDDVTSTKCDVIILFFIYGQYGAIWKPGSGCIICKTYLFINLLSYKSWKLKNLSHSS